VGDFDGLITNNEVMNMKILVLNGSPKGELSITLQYVGFIQRKFRQHEMKVIHVSQIIRKLERDETAFQEIINEVKSSDGVLWIFGVFVLAVPAQYMRFIELISERHTEDVFKDKYTAVLSTSIHFFDHTAHNYMRAICEDLNMKYSEALSLDIIDLMNESGRKNLTIFAENFFESIEKKASTSKLFKPLLSSNFTYSPALPGTKVDLKDKRVVLLTDKYDRNTNSGKMIDRFRQSFSGCVELISLNDIDMQGGCLGCMRCGYDNKCVQKDGFTEFYNQQLRTADIIVFAGTVNGRYLSSIWKMFYDRAFFWTHTPSLVGKQFGYIISGPLSQIPNLVQILEASSTTRQDANHVDIITDECENSAELDSLLQNFAERLVSYSEKGYIRTKNFLVVGGQKVFRDDIWGRLRMIWQADHRYYKKHGKYDFPQTDLKMWVFNPVMLLLSKIPKFRKTFYANITKFSSGRLKKL
jgi:multimeric flavodoxin WrbA